MAKKVNFPLDMGNDIKARSIEELKANYNAEKVTEYFLNGKLLTWLEDRYYDEEAEQIRELSEQSHNNPAAKLAKIFGVEINESVDVETLEIRRKKLEKLREITSEDEILDNVDRVAFSQEELGDLLDDEVEVIYLCGESFRIPLSVKNVRYVGVNNPAVTISGKGGIDLEANEITIERCELSDDTKERIVSQNTVNKDDEYEDIEYTDEKYFKFENKDGWVRLKKYTGKDSVVKIPNNVNEICTKAFQNNQTVEKIIIPNSVTKIDRETFAMCENLEYSNVPYGVEEIGAYAFQNCNLKNIKIPDSVTKIDVGAFKGCKYLVNIILPCNLTEIGDQAFDGCESLMKIDFPNGLRLPVMQVI